jgi:gliding motility-associated-like protein
VAASQGVFYSAIDPSGNYLYASGFTSVQKINITGYSITPALPQGLAIDSTGTIKGTPAYALNSTDFTVSAYNIYGKGSAMLNITVTGTIYQLFAPQITYPEGNGIFTIGKPVTALIPANAGGAIPDSTFDKVSTFALNVNVPNGEVADNTGNIYVTNGGTNTILKINRGGVISTFAGSGAYGSANGMGAAASFGAPTGLAIDIAGNIYVADTHNNLIRKITPAGMVSTFAGSGASGAANGPAATASFSGPQGLTIDALGNLYVADTYNNLIRKITPAGIVSTCAGTGTPGATNGADSVATFNNPHAIVIDGYGNLYVNDQANNTPLVRKITPLGITSTYAGGGVNGGNYNTLAGIAVDFSGNVYVTDNGADVIYKIAPANNVYTYLPTSFLFAGRANYGYAQNGIGTAASFRSPTSLGFDTRGNMYVGDLTQIRRVSLQGYAIDLVVTDSADYINANYSESQHLPPGLSFNATNGFITGSPTADSAATNYIYFITGYNAAGSSTTTLSFTINPATTHDALAFTQPETAPVIHTAVSPNGDGKNDVLTIDNIHKYPQNTLMLMNTSGTKVYQASRYDNINNAFDGHSNINGKLQQPGTYFYMLQYTDNGVVKSITGYIVLKY